MPDEREARHLAELLKAQGIMAEVLEVPNDPPRPACDGETLSDEPTVRDVVRYIDTVLAPALGEPGTPVSFETWWMFRRARSEESE